MVMAPPQTAPNTDPINCSKLALSVPPRLLWVATTAAIAAQKLWERPNVTPSAKVTAAAAVMRRVSHNLVRWRPSHEGQGQFLSGAEVGRSPLFGLNAFRLSAKHSTEGTQHRLSMFNYCTASCRT